MEKDFDIIGSTAIEDKLQDGVGETIQSLKDAGIKVVSVIPTVAHAVRMEAEDVDAVVASGCDAADGARCACGQS